jgi:hypothetical protein
MEPLGSTCDGRAIRANERGRVLWTRAAIKPRLVSASEGRLGFELLTGGSAIRACHVSVTMRTVPRLPLGSLYSETPGVSSVAWLTCAPSKLSSKAPRGTPCLSEC